MICYIGLGGNLGERVENLRAVVAHAVARTLRHSLKFHSTISFHKYLGYAYFISAKNFGKSAFLSYAEINALLGRIARYSAVFAIKRRLDIYNSRQSW
mgnify:CR=1 FL=1